MKKNKYIGRAMFLISSMAFLCFYVSEIEAARPVFSGNSIKVLNITPEKNTGLDDIFIAYSVNNISISYTGNSASQKWYRYSNLGGGYAEEIKTITHSGSTSTLNTPQGDMGYIIEDGTDRYYFWLVDYSAHRLNISAIEAADEQDCSMTNIMLSGSGEPIRYYTINGQAKTLNQDIKITYNTLEWNSSSNEWEQVEAEYSLENFSKEIHIMPPPYCNTTFTVSGDRFLREWNWEEHAASTTFYSPAVDVRTEAIQTSSENDKSNLINQGNDGSILGGSAPADITFYAYTTDNVIHNEWQMSRDPEFETIDYRFSEQDLNYIFQEEGTFYLRFIGSNSDGSCEVYSDVYTVGIGASDIICPNAFSPGTSEGINDEWKVSYRSIISFKCWIFNRYGVEMCRFDNPEQGWDGRYRGKFVKPGVYYYVIEAEGADGKKYKLSGDINIINFKSTRSSSTDSSVEPVQ